MWLWLPLVSLLLAGAGILVWRGAAVTRLAARGERINAVVIGKGKGGAGSTGVARCLLKVEYVIPQGRTYRRTVHVGFDEWDAAEPGSEVAFFYLPDRPSVCAPAVVVEQARAALARKRSR